MKVSVVMPAYNEAPGISSVLAEVSALPFVDEIVVVDDGSTDGTAQVAQQFDKVRVKQHPYNIGNGAAVKSGIRAATGDILVFMDADGQHPPAEIEKMLPFMEQYDMVVGARSRLSDALWYRNLANRVFNTYASYLVGYRIPDLTSGFRIMQRDRLKHFIHLLPNGFSYPSTITIAYFQAGFAVKYHSFASPARTGKSKIRLWRDGVRFLLKITYLGVFFVPMKIFLPISAMLLIPGLGYVFYRLVTAQRFSGFAGMLAMMGLLIFVLGLVSERGTTNSMGSIE